MEEGQQEERIPYHILLRDFVTLQEERVQGYQRLEQALKTVLENHDIEHYQATVRDITDYFGRISSEIIEIEEKIRANYQRRIQLADQIRQIQECEREKLLLTTQLHMLRSQGDQADGEALCETLTRLEEVIEEINDIFSPIRYALSREKARIEGLRAIIDS
eukprot:gnl/Trimastix_PCT/4188.p1 GENE.gnl/Trimastix_PCT/4188~~gnl/Trimastix_PCT/4188.p1  ORF type:complete len:171 (-),score=24.40 gnl/Trimastix_PCT/4188:53-538(-)